MYVWSKQYQDAAKTVWVVQSEKTAVCCRNAFPDPSVKKIAKLLVLNFFTRSWQEYLSIIKLVPAREGVQAFTRLEGQLP